LDVILAENFAYKKKQMSTDRESGRGNKRARVTRGSYWLRGKASIRIFISVK
jgi:hypothetical protein